MHYDKPPLIYDQQVELLVQRGMTIENPGTVAEILRHINYYRLSAYFRPFQDNRDCFRTGSCWENILALYEFDRCFSLWLVETLAEVEIGFRTQLAYYLAHSYGPFGYTQSPHFSNDFRHGLWLTRVRENVQRSHETFVTHFRSKYTSENNLPVWMVCEVISFGQISQLYRGLKRHDRQILARDFYGLDQGVFGSWLHALVYVRNLCAHHSRIWNRTLAIRPRIPRRSALWQGIRNDKIFCILLICKTLLHWPDRWAQLSNTLKSLLQDSPSLPAMGFPKEGDRRLEYEESSQ